MLLFASAGVLHHSGIKIPFFAFFAHNSGLKPKEAPINMIVAMIISSILCVAIGVFPSLFYQILPYDVSYQPYDFSHVLSQMQLLTFAAFAFICLWHFKIYPPELNSTVLNSDWFYRKMIPGVLENVIIGFKNLNSQFNIFFTKIFQNTQKFIDNLMYKNRVFDREAGFDTLIVVQVFGIVLLILIILQFSKF